MLIRASQPDAWGPTVDPLDVLELPEDLSGGANVAEHMMYCGEWAGTLQDGELTWTEYDRRRQQLRTEGA